MDPAELSGIQSDQVMSGIHRWQFGTCGGQWPVLSWVQKVQDPVELAGLRNIPAQGFELRALPHSPAQDLN